MKHRINGPFHFYRLRDIVTEERESGVVSKSGKVLQAPRNKAIHAANQVPCGKQLLAKVTSQETCSAGDDNPHEAPAVAASLPRHVAA
jgi:hypothetical protein